MITYLLARIALAKELFLHLISAPFVNGGDVKRWLKQLKQEQLGPVPNHLWAVAKESGKCIHCGLCDIVDAPTNGRSITELLAYTRRPQDAPLGIAHIKELKARAQTISHICPTGVNISGVTSVLIQNAKVLNHNT